MRPAVVFLFLAASHALATWTGPGPGVAPTAIVDLACRCAADVADREDRDELWSEACWARAVLGDMRGVDECVRSIVDASAKDVARKRAAEQCAKDGRTAEALQLLAQIPEKVSRAN